MMNNNINGNNQQNNNNMISDNCDTKGVVGPAGNICISSSSNNNNLRQRERQLPQTINVDNNKISIPNTASPTPPSTTTSLLVS